MYADTNRTLDIRLLPKATLVKRLVQTEAVLVTDDSDPIIIAIDVQSRTPHIVSLPTSDEAQKKQLYSVLCALNSRLDAGMELELANQEKVCFITYSLLDS